jgi:thiol-disulfide isomerase/thioredoxin
MDARPALLAGVCVLALAGCASPSADDKVSSPSSAAVPDVAPTAKPLPSTEPEESLASTDVAEAEEPSGPGSYVTFADYEADPAAYADTDVVLFFNADWCSTCKIARDNIQSDLAAIPSGLTIVVVDFDTANDLRQKYGVTVQHTFVQVDADGNELAKWSGSVTADEIAQNTV